MMKIPPKEGGKMIGRRKSHRNKSIKGSKNVKGQRVSKENLTRLSIGRGSIVE